MDKTISVSFYDRNTIKEADIKYVVITAFYGEQLVVVRHNERTTLEIPGGHIEEFESGDEAARRELYEETGAIKFDLRCLGIYSVDRGKDPSYGLLYYADIKEIGPLPDSEIAEVKLVTELPENLTYPLIQPKLYKRVLGVKDLR